MSLVIKASEVESKSPPRCPTCGEPMRFYGATHGYVCCEWKLLRKASGWLDENGRPVRDRRLTRP
jgi:tRNA(Ile2) C34 agmatinyltransferase TiaS